MFIDNASSDWTEVTLSDIADITMGQSPSGSSYNEDGTGTIFFQGRAEFGFRFPTVRLFTTEPKRMAHANDTLMSVRAPVGDLNVAHQEIDLKNDKTNHGNSGFTDEEREKMSLLLQSGFVDSFRYLYPQKEMYSWWSYMFHAREKNMGWRIDYFLVSENLKDKIKDAYIYTDVIGSDHCPIGILLEEEI